MENENATSQEEQKKEGSENTEKVNESVESKVDTPDGDGGEGKENFDATAFSQITEEKKPVDTPGEDGKQNEEKKTPTNTDEDDSLEFDWASYDEPENVEEKKTDVESPKDTPTDDNNPTEEAKTDNVEQPKVDSSLKDDAYKHVASELGLEASSLDELKEQLQAIQKENDDYRQNANGGLTNDAVAKLEGFQKLSDEELVKLELKQQGFSDDEITNAVDGYTDNNSLWIEAKKIRNTIKGAIKKEQDRIAQNEKQSLATQEKERQEAVKSLTEHIKGQDSMFGFKMAKDETTLQKVHEGHTKYITSGDFLADITKDNTNLTEAAWLWKNREVILKAIGSREFNKGKQQIMDDITNPDVPDKSRFRDPDGSDEFDPKLFGQTSKKS